MRLAPIINSLLDTDLYKFNMDQVIFHKHTDLSGEYYFRCRNEGIVFTPEMFEEINAQIDHLCTLTFTKDELDYLRSIRFIKNDYVEFLRLWRPIRDYVETRLTDEGRLKIVVRGPLFSAMQFEIYLLEIGPGLRSGGGTGGDSVHQTECFRAGDRVLQRGSRTGRDRGENSRGRMPGRHAERRECNAGSAEGNRKGRPGRHADRHAAAEPSIRRICIKEISAWNTWTNGS